MRNRKWSSHFLENTAIYDLILAYAYLLSNLFWLTAVDVFVSYISGFWRRSPTVDYVLEVLMKNLVIFIDSNHKLSLNVMSFIIAIYWQCIIVNFNFKTAL